MPMFFRRLGYWLRWSRRDQDLVEELAAHRAMAEEAHEAAGVAPAEAAWRARRQVGNELTARERARDVWIAPWLQDTGRDVRIAVRRLWADRGFTTAAIITLALGIGANTTIFTIVNAINWRGLPVDEPDRIVTISVLDATGQQGGVSLPGLSDWQADSTAFVGLAGMRSAAFNIGDPASTTAAQRVAGVYLSWNFLDVLGDRPVLGRAFAPEDDRQGAEPVILLGHRLWQEKYDGSPEVVGRPVTVDGRPATVIGVMPDGFGFPALADAWMPLAQAPDVDPVRRNAGVLRAFGRMQDGVTREGAAAELTAINARSATVYADAPPDTRVLVDPFTGRANEPFLYGLFTAVALVLLLACANVTSLLLARARARSDEVALCTMLGASRWRVVRQLLAESLLMAMMAGVVGLLVAKAGVQIFVGDTNAASLAYWVRWSMDARVFAFLCLASLVALILCGVLPALYLSRRAGAAVLRAGGRTTGEGPDAGWITGALLVGELALALVLVTGATLMVQSLLAMQARDTVIDPTSIVTSRISPSPRTYDTAAKRLAVLERLESELSATRALEHVGLTTDLPFSGAPSARLSLEGQTGEDASRPRVLTVGVSPGYFDALGLSLVTGRPFTAGDGGSGRSAAIVNQAFESRFFPGGRAIGARIRLDRGEVAEPPAWVPIVGVAPTVRQQPQAQDSEAVVYLPLKSLVADAMPRGMALLVRSRADSVLVTRSLRTALGRLDAELALSDVVPLERAVSQSRWTHRLFSRVLSVFAAIALVVAMVGLYGITAYVVGRRRREIGVRMALGARHGDVAALFVRGTFVPVALGLVVGGAGAIGLGTLLGSLLVDTSATDPRTVVTSAGLLVSAVVLATALPLGRAMRVDPAVTLRHE